MTDGIGRLSGYGNYGVGGYMPQRKDDTANEKTNNNQQPVQNREEQTVDPAKVMDFLAGNNFFIAQKNTEKVNPMAVDTETQDRVAGYMEQFEMIYGLVREEFGDKLAPAVMDLVMDKLMVA